MKTPLSHNRASYLIGCNLARKYSNAQQLQQNCTVVAKSVISNITGNRKCSRGQRIRFDEVYLGCDDREYLRRAYKLDQYWKKISALAQHYKYYPCYPYHMGQGIEGAMEAHQQARNKYQRRVIKKLMNEPSSISETQRSSGMSSSLDCVNRFGKNEYSTKLRDLDSGRSSFFYQQFCSRVDQQLAGVKLYQFYKGAYNDGSKQFKQYLTKNQTKSKLSNNDQIRKLVRRHELRPTDDNQQTRNFPSLHNLRKFNSNRQFRQTFNSAAPADDSKKIKRKQLMSRPKRNRTVNCKPQSFSKTTANDTVCRQEQTAENGMKKRISSTMRLRKCKTQLRPLSTLSRNKSKMNLPKLNQVPENKQNEHRANNPVINSRPKQIISSSKSRTLLKNPKQKKEQKSLSRKPSRNIFSRPPEPRELLMGHPEKMSQLSKLIKAKLKLRA